MIKVKCIDATNTTTLKVGETYYAFPVATGKTAYISRFPRRAAHFGGFSYDRFEPITTQPKAVKCHKYVYTMPALNRKYEVFGYSVNERLIAIYKDIQLEKLIGHARATDCEELQELNMTKLCSGTVFPIVLRIGDFDGVSLYHEERIIQPIIVAYEQLSLF